MIKQAQSHENNNSNSNPSKITNPDFTNIQSLSVAKAISALISYQSQQATPEASLSYNPEELFYLSKAKAYNIALNEDDWCELTDLHAIDAVQSWERALKEAMYLGVNWKMNDYDPQGLELAIREAEDSPNEERRQVNAYYYSSRGV